MHNTHLASSTVTLTGMRDAAYSCVSFVFLVFVCSQEGDDSSVGPQPRPTDCLPRRQDQAVSQLGAGDELAGDNATASSARALTSSVAKEHVQRQAEQNVLLRSMQKRLMVSVPRERKCKSFDCRDAPAWCCGICDLTDLRADRKIDYDARSTKRGRSAMDLCTNKGWYNAC